MESNSTALEKAEQASFDEDKLLEQYGVGSTRFAGTLEALYERHLKFDNVVELESSDERERYEAAARAVRETLSDRWLRTDETYAGVNPKRVYYVSIEFLIGRSLANNVMNLMLDPVVERAFDGHGREWIEILDQEPDAGLGAMRMIQHSPSSLIGVPYDRPVIGYGGRTVNTLRLWSASAAHAFDFQRFSGGDFVASIAEALHAETLTRVLYPDDETPQGRGLRLAQEYFLIACSLADIARRFRNSNTDWRMLPEKAAIQLNDTHPSLAVPELMRILLDEARLGWDEAWDLTQRTLAYTNHTLLPEALERWPVEWMALLIPRHLEIIYEINRRLLDDIRARFPGDGARVARTSLVEEGQVKQIRMANLAIVGSHSTNGVAAIHSELLRKTTVRDLAEAFPDRFNNKTNGVTPRRWLRLANPFLAETISAAIGDSWITDLTQLQKLRPLANDAAFRAEIQRAKRAAKARFSDWLRTQSDTAVFHVKCPAVMSGPVPRLQRQSREDGHAVREYPDRQGSHRERPGTGWRAPSAKSPASGKATSESCSRKSPRATGTPGRPVSKECAKAGHNACIDRPRYRIPRRRVELH
jgi:glucan phosphorylase